MGLIAPVEPAAAVIKGLHLRLRDGGIHLFPDSGALLPETGLGVEQAPFAADRGNLRLPVGNFLREDIPDITDIFFMASMI